MVKERELKKEDDDDSSDVLCNAEFCCGMITEVTCCAMRSSLRAMCIRFRVVLLQVQTNDGSSSSSLSPSSAMVNLRNMLEGTTLAVCFATTWIYCNVNGTSSLDDRQIPKY
mmetsp:Transcript_5633/g.8273  ORF Transcript_5633/g.8273 Transcript_5633/m.8273 type:complete len:112 (-) Transcript_5633:333-668(-)